MQHRGRGALTQHAGAGVLMRCTGAGALMQRAGWGHRCGAQARGIDAARRGRGVGPSRRAGGIDPAHRGGGADAAGALTRHAWVGLTQHARVSTQHAGTGGVDAGQGCSQGEGRWQHEKKKPLRLALGAGEWLWRHEKNGTPTRSHLRQGWGLGNENPLSRAWSEGGGWGGYEGQLRELGREATGRPQVWI